MSSAGEGLNDRATRVGAVELDAARDADDGAREGGRGGRRSLFGLQAVAFLIGLGLLIYVLNRVGLHPVFDALAQIGFGLIVLIGVSGLRHLLRALAMRTAVPREHRNVTIMQAFSARLGGEAVTFLTFTGPLLGEATKAALLKKRVPLETGVQALVVDNLLYNVSVVIFILSGAVMMMTAYDLPAAAEFSLVFIAVCAVAALSLVALAFSRRFKPVSWLLETLSRRGWEPKFLRKRDEDIHRVESNVYDFYHTRRRAFFTIVGLDLLSHASSVLEVYLTLRMLGLRPSASAPFIIESLTKVINFVFSFVPGTIGVYEGGTEVILRTLGFAAATGVTLGLVRKAGMVFWTGMGLLALTSRGVRSAARAAAERHPRLLKLMDNLVLSNIAHRPARTLVTVAGVAVGVLLVVFTVGLANGVLRERGRREASVNAEIMLRASGTMSFTGAQSFGVPVELAREIESIEGVRSATALGQTTDKSEAGWGNRLIDGVDFEDYRQLSGIRMVEGRGPAGGDEAMVDTVWIAQKNGRVRVGDTVTIYDRPFRIVGIYEPPGGARIKIPLAAMQDYVGSGGHASSILVGVTDPARQDEVAARIHERFPDEQIIFTRDLPELYASGVPALNAFLGVVVAVAAAISLLVILLAMYTTVTERTRQIGVLKSLGMSNGAIAWVIEQEAIIVSLLGVAAGLALTFAARFALTKFTSLTVEIEPRWVLFSLVIGLAGGTLGALYPAIRAARQDAVAALSYE